MARRADYKVDEPEYRPHSRIEDKKQFDLTISVTYFDHYKNEWETRVFSFFDEAEIKELIDREACINLNGCYVNNISTGIDPLDAMNNQSRVLTITSARFSCFNGTANFIGSKNDTTEICFDYALFLSSEVSFYKAKLVADNISFLRAIFFSEVVNFSKTEFICEKLIFDYAYFQKHCRFILRASKFMCNFLTVNEVSFGKIVSFEESEFTSTYISMRHSKFVNALVSFMRCEFTDCFISLSSSRFMDCDVVLTANFTGCPTVGLSSNHSENSSWKFDYADLTGVTLSMSNSSFSTSSLSFLNSMVSHSDINLANSQFRRIDFSDELPQDIHLHHSIVSVLSATNCMISSSLNLLTTKIDRLAYNGCICSGYIITDWRENNLAAAIEANLDDNERTPAKNHARAAETALLLKENFRKLGRYEDEDDAYHCYKRHQLREKLCERYPDGETYDLQFALKWLIFEKLGGYGTRPWNILKSIPVVMGFFALVNHVLLSLGWASVEGIVNRGLLDWKSFTCSLYFSAITFLTIGFGDLAPTSWPTRLLAGAEGLIGLLLVAYFTIAFSRKVLR